jgi:hypothetical protein
MTATMVQALVCLFCFNVAYSATYYVDASRPNDNGNGWSPATAWKTIDKVNAANLLPGDVVLFRRGEVFRGTLIPRNGNSTSHIRYGAYGSGPKPRLYGSINKSGIRNWKSAGYNLWKTTKVRTVTGDAAVDAGNLIFNSEQSVGWKVPTRNELNSQGKFWSDPDHSNNKAELIMYSVGNPGSQYSNIEIALRGNVINQDGRSYIIYENLDLRYAGSHGIAGSNAHHTIARSCDFSYIGGSYLSGTTRYGNGVEYYNGANDNLVERCYFNQIYDVAMTAQGKGNYQAYNLYFNNNIVTNCEQSFEFWVKGDGASAHDIYFMNNTCSYAGMGWSHAQRPDPNGTHLLFWGSSAPFYNLHIRNNIFYLAANSGIFESRKDLSDLDSTKIFIDNNDWHLQNMNAMLAVRTGPVTEFTPYSYSYYRSNMHQDANSIVDNPLLSANYSISANSPCVDKAVTSPGITHDYVLTPRPQGFAPDIGAYEYKPSKRAFTLLPIGDSMTEGQDSTSGGFRSYRGTLYNKFVAAGYTPNFLGPKYSVPAVGGDPDHAGYGGYQIGPSSTKNNIDAQLTSIFKVAPNPTVIVMAFGWNSIYQEPAVAATKYRDIVNKVRAAHPHSMIIVATVPPQQGQTEAETQAQLLGWGNVAYRDVNAQARSMASASATDNIFLADLASGSYLSSGYWDVIHFLQGNADIEAEIIFEAVKTALGSSGNNTPTHGPGSAEND